ncbi:MAG TPA: hypothetical protein VFY69_11180 [Solirubrobacterales bacterium]|nr:hypothetical protein [Solirubrobacterales bacterium]
MVATEREALFEITADIRVRYRRSEPPPPYTYAVTIEVDEGEGKWLTVRLWDNADDVHEHHVHEYTRQGEKQEPTIRKFDSVNEAMALANAEARENAKEIVRQWRRS